MSEELEQFRRDDHTETHSSGMAAEAVGQLSNFVKNSSENFESIRKLGWSGELGAGRLGDLRFNFGLSEKERNQAIDNVSKSLELIVKGDIPHLRERIKELGLSTREISELEAAMDQKLETTKPFVEAILKGDSKTLQKQMSEMNGKQLEETVSLAQRLFDKKGLGLYVDWIDGKLIVSGSGSYKAVAVSKDKIEMLGVGLDGSYDFNKKFRHADPSQALKEYAENALVRSLHRNQVQQIVNRQDQPNVVKQ